MTAASDTSTHDAGLDTRRLVQRALGLTALLALELMALVRVYRAQAMPNARLMASWIDVNALVMKAAFLFLNFGAVIAVALVLVNWRRRHSVIANWTASSHSYAWRPWVFANLFVFATALAGALALNAHLEHALTPPWAAFALWCGWTALAIPPLGLAFAPVRYWLEFARSQRAAIGVAFASALIASLVMAASQRSWDVLSDWTLRASVAVLQLYERDLSFDFATNMVRVQNFGVLIGAPCSGFQGIGLVTTFLALFLWSFRNDLKFPNALLIIPIGAVAIWCLNVIRIVTLVSVGAHLSPSIALGAFHDHAGWLMFLAAAVSLMFATYRIRYFRAGVGGASTETDPTPSVSGLRLALAYLLPFIATITAGMIAKTFSANGQPLYPLVVAAACAAMWPYRDVYAKLIATPQTVSVAAGLIIGAAWVATDPGRGATSALAVWLTTLPPWLAIAWVCIRVFGSALLVPAAEELAFRGYLHRALIGRRFEDVAQGQFTWLAFGVSTASFAIMHQRWLSAAIAGAVYAMLMYRTNRLSDAVVAHIASNALIAAWAILWSQWSLL